MKRLVHLLIFVIWLVGAVTGGLTVEPEASVEAPRFVSGTSLTTLAVEDSQVVLTVDVSESTAWQFAAPAPALLTDWLRESSTAPSQRETSSRKATPVVSSFIVTNPLLP